MLALHIKIGVHTTKEIGNRITVIVDIASPMHTCSLLHNYECVAGDCIVCKIFLAALCCSIGTRETLNGRALKP